MSGRKAKALAFLKSSLLHMATLYSLKLLATVVSSTPPLGVLVFFSLPSAL